MFPTRFTYGLMLGADVASLYGKPILRPEVHRFYGLMQRIASAIPKVSESELYI